MTKSLRSIPSGQRQAAIDRRIKSKSGGLGYWAAVDALKKIGNKASNHK